MGALLSIPLLTGGVGALGSSLCSGCLLFMGTCFPAILAKFQSIGGTAASAFCKSCNCNSSIATRVGFGVSQSLNMSTIHQLRRFCSTRQLIFALSSMLAYLSRTDIAIKQLEKLSWDWIKMDCSGGKCYGLLAVSLVLGPCSLKLKQIRCIVSALHLQCFISFFQQL